MDICRKTALDILMDFERRGTYPNLALKSRLRGFTDNRDQRFVTALVYGVIERKLTLDYYISKVSSVKINKINGVVINILRLGLYQIMFMSTPRSAACNSSVELAKTNGQQKSTGFVNAILRRLADTYESIPMPGDRTEYLSVKYSVSVPVLKILQSSLGEESATLYLQSALEHNCCMYAAVNTFSTDSDSLLAALDSQNVSAKKTELPGLLEITDSISVENLKAFSDGMMHIIGKPSYISALSLSPRPGDIVYDMCAAPGGKTFALACLCGCKAEISAFDLHEHKIRNIEKDVERLGLKNIKARVFDSSKLVPSLALSADRIMCDVPCSGLGMIHKKPDIKYRNTDLASLISLQKNILQTASGYLKPGGRLVYSTCTVNKEENEQQISQFLKNNPQFEIDKSVMIYDNNYGEMLFLPSPRNPDGFYIAVLRKKEVS